MRSTESINFHADKDINIEAEENINIRAGLYQNGDDKGYGKIKLEASDSAELLATNDFNVTVWSWGSRLLRIRHNRSFKTITFIFNI